MDLERPWWELARQTLVELFDMDGRMFTTIRTLMLRPGVLTREYLAGRRLTFTPPVRLYLVVSLLFFLVLPLITPESRSQGPAVTEPMMAENYSRMMFVLLPVFALLVKLFYFKRFYIQHLVFSMHLFAAMFVVFGVMLSMEGLSDQYLFWVVAQVAVFGYMVWYCLTALKVAYGQSWGKTVLKLAGLIVLFLPALAVSMELVVSLSKASG